MTEIIDGWELNYWDGSSPMLFSPKTKLFNGFCVEVDSEECLVISDIDDYKNSAYIPMKILHALLLRHNEKYREWKKARQQNS